MVDLYLEWNSDFVLTPNGSLQTAVAWDQVRERIIRRLFTNSAQRLPDDSFTVPDYIFDINYGIGAGALIGQNPTENWILDLNRRIRQAVLSDSEVDPGSVPQTVIKRTGSTYQIVVQVDHISGQSGRVSITLG